MNPATKTREEEANTQAQSEYNARLTTTGGYTPDQIRSGAYKSTSPVISSATLQSSTPLMLPEKQFSTTSDAIIASSDASAQDFQKQAEQTVAQQSKALEARQKETQGVMGNIARVYGDIKTTLSGAKEEENTIDPFRTELGNINTEIANQNVAYRGEADAIAKRGDISKEGQASLLQNVKDTYGRRLADLAIRQSAAQGNVTALESALDRKLEMALAPLKSDLQYYTDFELKNADLLTADEKDRLTEIKAEKNRLIEAETKKNTAIASVLKTALENGVKIPDSVASQVLKAGSDLEAYSILARNGITLAKPVVAGSIGGGVLSSLPVSIQGKIIASAEKFGTSDIVKKYNATIDSINVVNGINASSKNPADHQAIVYSFAKALDPDSAVKEGEYETIKKYAQSLISRYGKEVSNAINGTGFLSEKAITDIKTTMNNLQTSRKPQYDNLYNERARTINNIAGSDVAKEVLTDYQGGIGTQVTEAQVKNQVDEFVRSNPDKFNLIENLYSDPSISDFDVVEYLRLQGLIQ